MTWWGWLLTVVGGWCALAVAYVLGWVTGSLLIGKAESGDHEPQHHDRRVQPGMGSRDHRLRSHPPRRCTR